MNRRSKTGGGNTLLRATSWCWRRWISLGQEDLWIERLQAAGRAAWVLTHRPGGSRILLTVYAKRQAEVAPLVRQFGGQTRGVKAREWASKPTPPLQIGRRLQIVHEKPQARNGQALPRLYIPQGMAFGSGEHATTRMLLQALTRHPGWKGTAVLDLGTGSGVLALTARLFGARKIVATDFDPDAVRIARENEALNFSTPFIHWRCADVKRLRATSRYDLVLANLFSGILSEAAPQIAGCLLPGAQLWLSGILRSQQAEVVAAYRRRKLRLIRVVGRGKWVMIQMATAKKPWVPE